jgi:hypothetical protein
MHILHNCQEQRQREKTTVAAHDRIWAIVFGFSASYLQQSDLKTPPAARMLEFGNDL